MKSVATAGSRYGLQFNWTEIEALPVNCRCSIRREDGDFVKVVNNLKYLGSVLSADGTIGSELARRLGAASLESSGTYGEYGHTLKSRGLASRRFSTPAS